MVLTFLSKDYSIFLLERRLYSQPGNHCECNAGSWEISAGSVWILQAFGVYLRLDSGSESPQEFIGKPQYYKLVHFPGQKRFPRAGMTSTQPSLYCRLSSHTQKSIKTSHSSWNFDWLMTVLLLHLFDSSTICVPGSLLSLDGFLQLSLGTLKQKVHHGVPCQ